jgi:hypothetical protein
MKPRLTKSEKFELARTKWENTRSRGETRFALLYGSAFWGGWMFVFMSCARVFYEHRILSWPYLLGSLVIWPIGGYLLGLTMWDKFEKRYNKPTNKPPSVIAN